jgi:hypothetical protein
MMSFACKGSAGFNPKQKRASPKTNHAGVQGHKHILECKTGLGFFLETGGLAFGIHGLNFGSVVGVQVFAPQL